MVFEDISRPTSQANLPIAQVHDRFLAFAFDLCLCVPIGSILLKPLWSRIRYLSLEGSASNELMGMFALTAFAAVLIFVVSQALMTWIWGATPGKKFFHLSVVTVVGQKSLSLGASFTRSLMLVFEFLLLGVPLLELLSHADRRPWHDRVAETIVVTHKSVGGEAPHWIEQRFFRNLYWTFALVACVYLTAQIKTFFRTIEHGDMKREELVRAGYLCSELTSAISAEVSKDPSRRLDMGIALYMGGAISGKCLDSEADFVIWTQESESLPWAHLARAMFFEEQGKDAKAEFSEVCRIGGESSAACALAQWRQTHQLPKNGLAEGTWAFRVGKLNDYMRSGRFESVAHFVNSHQWPEGLAPIAQAKRLQSLWMTGTEKEFSLGLDLLRVGWSSDARVKLEAWSCLAQLTQHCGDQKATACQALTEDLNRDSQVEWSQHVVLARARETVCSNRHDPGLQALVGRAFRGQSADEENWIYYWLFPKAASSKTRWTKIYDGAVRMTADDWLYGQALWALATSAEQLDHVQKLERLFARGPSDDVFWWMANREYQTRAKRLGLDAQPEVQMRAPTSADGTEPHKEEK